MKATIKPKIIYEVTIDGKSKGEFKKTGELSGMVEMRQGNKMLVVDRSKSLVIFADLFFEEQEVDIVKASPELIEK